MKTKLRVLFTFFLMLIFFWTWPVRLFTNKNNCYFWTLEQLITEGGRAKWYPSNRWIGYHVIWIDFGGQGWEYTVPRMKRRTPWTSMLFYDGEIRKFRSRIKDQ